MKIKAVLASLLLSFTALFSASAETRRIGNWWWWGQDGYDATICDAYLDEMQNAAVTEIYFYGCAEVMKGGSSWTKVHTFVQKAMAHNMRVAFLYDDWPDFDTDGGATFLNTMVPQYLAYKAQYPQDAVYGIHFDIELNKSGGYNTTTLQNYCDKFIDKIQSARAQGIHCEVDVGCGWDVLGGSSVVYNGVTGIFNIIAQYCDTVAMMSYRDTAEAIIASADRGALAACINNGTEFLLGVETDDSGEDDKVDFSAEDKPYLFQEMDKVFELLDAMDLEVGYGMAIHQTRTFYALPGSVPDGNDRNTWGTPVAPTCKAIDIVSGTADGLSTRKLSLNGTVPGVLYTVFAATEVTGPYTAVADSIPCLASDTGAMEFDLPDLGNQAFYKITASDSAIQKGASLP